VPDADATWRTYERMRLRLSARISQELTRESGFSDADLEVLTALSCAPAQTLQALSLRCALEWEKSRLSHQLRRMEQRGLIARRVCSEDGRAAIVGLTETGRCALAAATFRYQGAVRRWFTDVLSDQQLTHMDDISRAILAGLGATMHANDGD
jgi:DNA-binding MarR family transcriptional regulator